MATYRDLQYPEVRIRQGSDFQQVPNFVVAAEALLDGQFVTYTFDGQYHKTLSATERATHFVQRSGVARVTVDEIRNQTGKVQQGEPVMAHTGSGTVTIPFASNVFAGQELVVEDGYAVGLEMGAYAPADFVYVIGRALADVTIEEGATLAWGDAHITLPAQMTVTTITETETE
jgi:hypothetical protein